MRAALVLCALAVAAPAQAADALSLTTGVSFASGRFTAPTRTDILIVPTGLRYATGPFRFTATLPYLHIESVGTVLVGNGAPVVLTPGDPAARRRTRDGVGDLQLGASYALPEALTGAWLIEVSGQVKVPTASRSRGLGTGKTDGAIGLDVSRAFGNFVPFANASYRFLGSPPGFDLRDSVGTSVGATYTFGRSFVTLSYDYNRSVTRFLPDAHEVFAGVSGPAIGRLNWTAFGTAGLSSGAPDYGLGMVFSYKLGHARPPRSADAR